ncbi:Uncharacterised protein [Providencia alcalifaciens]|nr:Uncharacterised protein [Providencia alcalifaciens]
MLKFENLTIDVAQYRWLGRKQWSPLLHDISLDIQPGEMVALIGGSGGRVKVYYCKVHWDYYPKICVAKGPLSSMVSH